MKRLAIVFGLALGIGAMIWVQSVVAQRMEQRGGQPRSGMPTLPIIAALDADSDGELSAKEIDNAASALRTLDKNKDGKLTRDEMLPMFREGGREGGFPGGGANPEELVARMMAFDKNGDGKLSKSELPERMQGLLDRADANKDGEIDKGELTKHAQQQSGRSPGFGPGAGPGRGGFPGGDRKPGEEPRRVDDRKKDQL